MQIGILGSGTVARTLGTGLSRLGHTVKVSSRSVNKPELAPWLHDVATHGSVGTFADAARFGDMIFICTNWAGTEAAIRAAGPADFGGKVVVDVTNPLDMHEGVARLAVDRNASAGESIQAWLPTAHVVKAFNIITAALMTDGRVGGEPLDMFIAGNDPNAKARVTEILTAFHWRTHDLGGIELARVLEAFALLWIVQGQRTGKWNHAFRMVYR